MKLFQALKNEGTRFRAPSVLAILSVNLIGCADPFAPQKDPMSDFQSLKADVAAAEQVQRVQNLRRANLSTVIVGDGQEEKAQAFTFTEGELGEVLVSAQLRAGSAVDFDLQMESSPEGMSLEELSEKAVDDNIELKSEKRLWKVMWTPPKQTVSAENGFQQLGDVRLRILPKQKEGSTLSLPLFLRQVELVHLFPLYVMRVRETTKPSISISGWPSKEVLDLSLSRDSKNFIIQIEVEDAAALKIFRENRQELPPVLKIQDTVESTQEIQRVNALAGLELSSSRSTFDRSKGMWVFTRVINPQKIWDSFPKERKDGRLHVQLIFSAESSVDRGVSDRISRGLTIIQLPEDPSSTETQGARK